MGDHFWPSIYPCIAVGLLVGLAHGGIVNVALGALGGLAASLALFAVLGSFVSQEGLVPLAVLLGASAISGEGLIRAGRQLTGRS